MLLVIFIPEQNFCVDKKIFFSTRYNEVNVRNGPGTNHLIIYKIFQKGYPLVLLDEFDSWRKIADFEGRTGWISMSQLSYDKFGVINQSRVGLYMFPDKQQKKLAELGHNLTFEIIKCKVNWCKIKTRELVGWLAKESFWGNKEH